MFQNDGVGNFTWVVGNPFHISSSSNYEFGDIDNDNDQDLIITGLSDDGIYTELYENNGLGDFSLKNDSVFGVRAHSTASFGDFDGDNDMDICITGLLLGDAGSPGRVYMNDGNGNYTPNPLTEIDSVLQAVHCVADFDNDNDLDIYIHGIADPNESILYFNDGLGNFSPTGNNLLNLTKGNAISGDVNGDGFTDLLVCGKNPGLNTDSILLYINDGSGNLIPDIINIWDNAREISIELGDMDGDSDLDILINAFWIGTSTWELKMFENNGAGIFSLVSNTNVEYFKYDGTINLVDFDLDGDNDIITSGGCLTSFACTKVYMNIGNTYSLIENTPIVDVVSSSIKFADINGDNYPDFLIRGGGVQGSTLELYKTIACTQAIDTMTVNACGVYYSPSGSYYTTSGVYMDTTQFSFNCDSIFYIDLTIIENTLDTNVIYNDLTLISSENNANYQWYYCDNEPWTPISGEINQSYTLNSTSGSYSLIISNGLCIDSSSCLFIDLDLSIKTMKSESPFIIYPNPSMEFFKIEFNSKEKLNVELLNMTGKSIRKYNNVSSDQSLSLLGIDNGIYMVVVEGRTRNYQYIIKN